MAHLHKIAFAVVHLLELDVRIVKHAENFLVCVGKYAHFTENFFFLLAENYVLAANDFAKEHVIVFETLARFELFESFL